MTCFDVYQEGAKAEKICLDGAYAFGQDQIPVRADLVAARGRITCTKRAPGPVGIALLWAVGQTGRFLLPTTRLPEREEPYNLNLELARGQMQRIAQKREDWGLFDYDSADALTRQFRALRGRFIDALKAPDAPTAARIADEVLSKGVTFGEKMALFHADAWLTRRQSVAPTAGSAFGSRVNLGASSAEGGERLREISDFVVIPTPWKHIEPQERQHRFSQIDAWMNWAGRHHRKIHAGPLLSFDEAELPEWLYIWEHDYETLRDLIYERIQQILERYRKRVRVWNVVSGLHAHNSFGLSFEQIMELTRTCCLQVKQLAPRAEVMIELTMPWGEYYARDTRTIPPLLYADMAVQSGIKFDAFGVQLCQGVPADGFYVRDLLQVSSLLDEFMALGKNVHVTAAEVPSAVDPDERDAWAGERDPARAGRWHGPWSPRLQAEWLQALYRVAISKPFVQSICWRNLFETDGHVIPHGALCEQNMEIKVAYRELRNFRALLAAQEYRSSHTES